MCMSLCKMNASWESCRCEGVRVSEGVCRQSILSGEWLWALPQASEIGYPFSSTGCPSSQSKGQQSWDVLLSTAGGSNGVPGPMLRETQRSAGTCPTNPKQQNWTQEPGGTNSGLCLIAPPSQPPQAQKLPDPGTFSKARWGLRSPESTEVRPDLSLCSSPSHTPCMLFFFFFFSSFDPMSYGEQAIIMKMVFEDPHEVHFPCPLKAKKVCGGNICVHGEHPTYHLGARVHGGTNAGR